MIKLNLGCGSLTLSGFVNVDLAPGPGVDQVHDLDQPWPWPDQSVEMIEAKDVFEHVEDAILFMTESWRVLTMRGTLRIRTPHWRNRDAFTDPTHKRFPTEHTFDFWIPGTTLFDLHNRAYGGVSFERMSGRMDGGSMEFILAKAERRIVGAPRTHALHQHR